MKKQLLRLLLCAGLLAGLLTVTALAADWTYDPNDETLTNSGGTVTLKNVTDNGANGLVIGNNQDFTGVTLDLTGQITDGSGATYTLISIGDQAFSQCEKLTTVDLSGCTNLSSIGQCTFTSCDDLTSMTLPNSLTGIGDEAFYGCSNLDELVLLSKNPPTLGEDALLAVSQDFRIIVPEENAEAYKTAEGWKDVAGSVHGLTYQLEVTPPNGSLEIFRGEPPRGQIPRR